MVVAGLLMGNRARQDAMSQQTEEYVDKLWELIDVVLNALLFVLIGVELLVIRFEHSYWLISLLAVGLGLAARFVTVGLPYRLVRPWLTLDAKAPLMMT